MVEFGFDLSLALTQGHMLLTTLPVLHTLGYTAVITHKFQCLNNNKGLFLLTLHVSYVSNMVLLHTSYSGNQAEGAAPILAFPPEKKTILVPCDDS